MEEIYKIIDGYENYSVSNHGNVKNIKTNTILKGGLTHDNYHHISLLDNKGKRKSWRVHRLIADAFIENPDNKPCVDHIDRNRTNNNINNLRWSTIQENNFNKTKSKKNTSGHPGVSYHHGDGKWRARIKLNGVERSINCNTIEEAIKVRAELAKTMFGTYAPSYKITNNINITNNIKMVDTLNINQQETK